MATVAHLFWEAKASLQHFLGLNQEAFAESLETGINTTRTNAFPTTQGLLSQSDMETIKINDQYVFLYFLIRPFYWFYKYFLRKKSIKKAA